MMVFSFTERDLLRGDLRGRLLKMRTEMRLVSRSILPINIAPGSDPSLTVMPATVLRTRRQQIHWVVAGHGPKPLISAAVQWPPWMHTFGVRRVTAAERGTSSFAYQISHLRQIFRDRMCRRTTGRR